jgi:hypothetical protein
MNPLLLKQRSQLLVAIHLGLVSNEQQRLVRQNMK